jgi:TonB family protein
MRSSLPFAVLIALFSAFVFGAISAQTSETTHKTPDTPKKGCTPPKPRYQPDLPSYHVKPGLGIVAVEALVDEKGHVKDARVVGSSGNKGFDGDALAYVRRWEFNPSLCNGKPAPTWTTIQVQALVTGS